MYAHNLVIGTYIYNDRLRISSTFFVVFFKVHILKLFNNIHITSKLNIFYLNQSMIKRENNTIFLRV